MTHNESPLDSGIRPMLKQLTIRGFDDELERALRELAERTGTSLNKAALLLMRRGAGQAESDSSGVIGSSLDEFFGVWSKEEAEEFLAAVKDLRKIDPELWK